MFAIVAHDKTIASLTEFRARVSATLSALAALRLLAPKTFEHPWFTLSERLLKDIGKTPIEAEIARLHSRWGVTEGAQSNPLAGSGVAA